MDILRCQTPPAWTSLALAHFDLVLCDHAHCEKKAAASALSFISQYGSHANLVRRCCGLAQEELRHFKAVHKIIVARGLTLGRDKGDPYVQKLLTHMRSGSIERLIDRLLVSSLVEARSCERLALLGDHLQDSELRRFYQGLAQAEAGHHRLFVKLAEDFGTKSEIMARLDVLASIEAQIVTRLPLAPRIH